MVFGIDDLLVMGLAIAARAGWQQYKESQSRSTVPVVVSRLADPEEQTSVFRPSGPLYEAMREQRKSQQEALYRKHAVSDSTVRLLVVKPDDRRFGPIECRFLVQPLKERMNHEAISYHWGESTLGKEVFVEQVPFEVTDNLWNALNNFRAGIGGQDRLMWVDALCIHQDEEFPEKNQQIRQMYKVYGFAKNVRVWLNNATYDSDRVANDFRSLDGRSPLSLSDEVLMQFYMQDPKRWDGLLKEFLRDAWWTRAWIVQEVMLAKNPTMHRGLNSLTFELLIRLSAFMVKYHLDPNLDKQTSVESARSRTRHEMAIYRSRLKQGFRVTLGEWIAKFHNQETANPRDLVYGFLGLAQSSESRQIDPQYEKPLEFVYAQGMKYIIQESESLDFICLGRAPSRGAPVWEDIGQMDKFRVKTPTKLPSWVPDLRVRDGFGTALRRPLPLNYGSAANHWPTGSNDPGASVFNASGLPFRGAFYFSNTLLGCFGVQIDVVQNASGKLCIINEDFANDYVNGSVTQQFVKDAEKLFQDTAVAKSAGQTTIQALSHPYPGPVRGHTWLQAFNKTMMLDLHYDESRLKPHEGFNFLQQLPPADFLSEESNQQVRLNRWKLHLHADQYTWSSGRRFITTVKGYMGIANWDVKEGDTVCVLEGASVPFVLRRSESSSDKWEFVGER